MEEARSAAVLQSKEERARFEAEKASLQEECLLTHKDNKDLCNELLFLVMGAVEGLESISRAGDDSDSCEEAMSRFSITFHPAYRLVEDIANRVKIVCELLHTKKQSSNTTMRAIKKDNQWESLHLSRTS